jgi:hypothetical protein
MTPAGFRAMAWCVAAMAALHAACGVLVRWIIL